MKILLVNPPWETERNKYGVRAGSRWAHTRDKRTETVTYYPFPFFLSYTTAMLKEKGFNATIKDCLAEGVGKEEFFNYISKEKFDVIVIETSTPSIYIDLKTAEEIKNKFGSAIIFCGTHTSALYSQVMRENKFIDFVMIGEYDYTAYELAKAIERGRGFDKVAGIAWRNGNAIKVNPRRELIKDLDKLPFPERDELPMDKYNEPFCKYVPNVQMITSRGCPNNCIFCVEPSVYYGRPNIRLRKPKNVVDEIEMLIKKYGPKEIYFDDASITIIEKHVRAISEELIRRNIKIKWSCMGDAKVSFDTLKLMKESGCIGIKFGVETADPIIAKNIRKFISLSDVIRMVRDCKKLGIFTHATYMFGLPGETKETIEKTIRFSKMLKTDTAQFSVAMPYPGTDFFAMAEKNGWLLTKNWSSFDGSGISVLEYPNLSKEEIECAVARGKKELFLNVLSNPRTLSRYIENSYKRDGFRGLVRNVIGKAKFIAEH